MKIKRRRNKPLLIVLVVVCVIVLVFALLLYAIENGVYKTTDVSLYKVYPKFNSKDIATLADRLFPSELEEYYENVTYSFTLNHWGGGDEIWLEFHIADSDKYRSHKTETLEGNETKPFLYDPSFEEYAVEDTVYSGGENGEYIELATVLKVLFQDETQTVIYCAYLLQGPMLYSSPSDYVYFTRFSIDPSDFPALYAE